MRGAAGALPVFVALTLAACSATAPAASPQSSVQSPSVPPPASVAVRTTPSPVPSLPSWSSIYWTAADPAPFSGPGNQYIFDGVPWGAGAVLVGEVAPLPTGNVAGAVWASPDGQHWQMVLNADSADFAGSQISAIASDGSKLVAVGVSRLEDNAATLTPPVGLAWVSTAAGDDLSRVPDPDNVLGQVVLRGVVGGPVGFIAYGDDLQGNAAVVVSTDGLHWQRDPAAEQVFAGSNVAAMMSTGDGLVAVGNEVVPPTNGVISTHPAPAAAWFSSDGRTWQRVAIEAGHYAIESVEPWVNSIRAVGSSDCPGCVGPPLEWRSTDAGRSWHTVPTDLAANESSPTFIGFDNRAIEMFEDPSVARWTSDGKAWTQLEASGSTTTGQTQFLIGSDGGILAIGSADGAGPNDQEDARVWLGTLQ